MKELSAYGALNVVGSKEAQRLLIDSLKTHTSARVRWGALDEWKHAWDSCHSTLDALKGKIHRVVRNSLEQKRLTDRVSQSTKKGGIEECLSEGVLQWSGNSCYIPMIRLSRWLQ